MEEPLAYTVVRTLAGPFFASRGVALDGAALSADEVTSRLENSDYVRLDGRRARPRGGRALVVCLVLRDEGRYTTKGPELRNLIGRVNAEQLQGAELDEVIVVAPGEDFLAKKGLTSVVAEYQRGGGARGADYAGAGVFYSVHLYRNFIIDLPRSKSVPPHRLLAPEEQKELFERQHIAVSALPLAYSDDPPVVWIGGREGQVVEITRDSPTAGSAVTYRRIVQAQL